MNEETRERIIKLIVGGEDIFRAFLLARTAVRLDPGVRYFIAPRMSLEDIPDPACVARHLAGKDPITREDVEQAFMDCLR
jgi:hypothetical protein